MILWVEFCALFVVAPVVMAVWVAPENMFLMLFLVTGVGLLLLWRTQGFTWAQLREGQVTAHWPAVLAIAGGTAVASFVVMFYSDQNGLFGLVRERPHIMVMIAVLYPLVSALPQELFFRALFFNRYRTLFPKRTHIATNATIFSLAHLMYWSGTVLVFTVLGGLIFAWAYEKKKSFLLAWVLHSVAGVVLFFFGMGAFFYSGNVVRPF
ncbi:MAG: lysostaphin resistance A-like protein [Halocynthiibacter sp.]